MLFIAPHSGLPVCIKLLVDYEGTLHSKLLYPDCSAFASLSSIRKVTLPVLSAKAYFLQWQAWRG
jgi:hypothetical protein